MTATFATRLPRRGLRALIVGAALLGLYAAAGFLLAPRLLRRPIERQAGALLDRGVALERLRLNPFALSATADGLRMNDRDGTPLLRWERLYVDFAAWKSLWRREWAFGEIHLVGAAGRLAMLPGGALNVDDIVTRLSAAPAEGAPPGTPPVASVGRLRIEDASLAFVDRSSATTFTTTLGPLRIDLRDFTTRRGEDNAYSFRGSTEAGETFSWNGRFALDPPGSDGTFTLEGVTLAKYHPYYRGVVPFDIRSGTADVRSGYKVAWAPTRRDVQLVDAGVTLHDLKLSEHQKEEIAVEAPLVEVSDGDADLMTLTVSIGSLATRGGRVLMRKTKEGRVNLIDMLLPFYEEEAAGGNAPAAGATPLPASAAPAPKVFLGEVSFADYTLDAEDLSPPRPARVHLDRINLTLRGVDNVPGTTAKGSVDLRWNEGGTVHADGDISFVGLDGDLNVAIDGIDVPPVDPYVEPVLDLRVTSGAFFAAGKARANLIDPAQPRFSFAGDVRMENFASVDGRDRGDLLRWKSVRLTKVDYSLERDRLRIGEVAIDGAEGVLSIAPDGVVNLATVLRLAPAPPDSDAPDPAAVAVAPAVPPAAADEGDTRVARARLRGGRIRLIDRTMTPPAGLALTRIEGTIAGLSSRPGARAEVHLTALVDDMAPVTLEGQVDPLGSDLSSDLALTGKGIDLGPLGPYAARYLGYALDRARLDLDMRYRLENRAVKGANVFTANPFLLGEKTDSPDATHLPVRLGLALLRDRNGVVMLDVPVEGSLDDPKFRLGRVILRALVNVFTKLVTSPFRLLARAFAGSDDVDLSVVDFGPGSAGLSDEAGARLDAVAKGLTERPGLALTIAGAADPAVDTEALRRGKLEGLLRAEKWRTLGRREREAVAADAVVVEPPERPKFLKAAWKTFRDLHSEASAAPKPETPEEIETSMLAGIAVDDGDLAALASARADAVRDRVAAAGIEAERLFLKQGAAAAARVSLELQ